MIGVPGIVGGTAAALAALLPPLMQLAATVIIAAAPFVIALAIGGAALAFLAAIVAALFLFAAIAYGFTLLVRVAPRTWPGLALFGAVWASILPFAGGDMFSPPGFWDAGGVMHTALRVATIVVALFVWGFGYAVGTPIVRCRVAWAALLATAAWFLTAHEAESRAVYEAMRAQAMAFAPGIDPLRLSGGVRVLPPEVYWGVVFRSPQVLGAACAFLSAFAWAVFAARRQGVGCAVAVRRSAPLPRRPPRSLPSAVRMWMPT